MNLAVDAMGGDFAPREIVLGAIEASPLVHHQITLVGDPAAIGEHLPKPCPTNVSIHAATEVIGMDEKPLDAIRRKKDSSLAVATNLVKEGLASAMISAGNTGAASAASLLSWRQIPGIHRPAIASPFPNRHGGFILLDAGASPDVDPEHLVEFAFMGRSYVSQVMGRRNPKVHLLNIGEEEGKGNAFAKQAYNLLAQHDWFCGNIEGKDLFFQPCDVVVCDAFVGNIVLKTSEGVAEYIMATIRDQVPKGTFAKLLYAPLRKVLAPLRKKLDYAEYGGSPLLGLNGLCVICHGRSHAKAIKNALLLAQTAVDNDLVATIAQSVAYAAR
ncbi:MAG TPA: phosphate acyltransferase PlsX [Fimbriimonadaceae bacterium]|nr:phosphate acyltransferase PlsX [Fimbriimonadaceae bacterium]HRJ97352.1 phosphate acyltransferase PlsX [Fimbriimonadaceae bacterium]